MMFNLMQFMINPQAMIQQAMNNPQVMNNPILKNAIDMAQRGDNKGFDVLTRNVGKERGVDVDQLMKQFTNFKS